MHPCGPVHPLLVNLNPLSLGNGNDNRAVCIRLKDGRYYRKQHSNGRVDFAYQLSSALLFNVSPLFNSVCNMLTAKGYLFTVHVLEAA